MGEAGEGTPITQPKPLEGNESASDTSSSGIDLQSTDTKGNSVEPASTGLTEQDIQNRSPEEIAKFNENAEKSKDYSDGLSEGAIKVLDKIIGADDAGQDVPSLLKDLRDNPSNFVDFLANGDVQASGLFDADRFREQMELKFKAMDRYRQAKPEGGGQPDAKAEELAKRRIKEAVEGKTPEQAFENGFSEGAKHLLETIVDTGEMAKMDAITEYIKKISVDPESIIKGMNERPSKAERYKASANNIQNPTSSSSTTGTA